MDNGYFWGVWIAVMLVPLLFSKESATWHPFQSDQVKEICANMTARERRSVMKRGAITGLALAGPFALVGLILCLFIPGSALKALVMAQPAVWLVWGLAFWKLKPRLDQSAKELRQDQYHILL